MGPSLGGELGGGRARVGRHRAEEWARIGGEWAWIGGPEGSGLGGRVGRGLGERVGRGLGESGRGLQGSGRGVEGVQSWPLGGRVRKGGQSREMALAEISIGCDFERYSECMHVCFCAVDPACLLLFICVT
jgi:hypothetical protein